MTDSIDRVFEKAITTIQALSTRSGYGSLPRPPLENRVQLYGLYKQATEGDVEGIIAKPTGNSPQDESAKKKWEAWKRQQGLSVTNAKRKYISYLIDTMRIYATGTLEARELLSELEYLWEQIRDIDSFDQQGIMDPSKNASREDSGGLRKSLEVVNSPANDFAFNRNEYNNMLYQEITGGLNNAENVTSSSQNNPPRQYRHSVASNISNNSVTNGLLQDLYDKTAQYNTDLKSLKKETKWAVESIKQDIKFIKTKLDSIHDNSIHNIENQIKRTSIALDADSNTHNHEDHDYQSIITSMYRYPASRTGATRATQLPYASRPYFFDTQNNDNNIDAGSNKQNKISQYQRRLSGGRHNHSISYLLGSESSDRGASSFNVVSAGFNARLDLGQQRPPFLIRLANAVADRYNYINSRYGVVSMLKSMLKKIILNLVVFFVAAKFFENKIKFVHNKDGITIKWVGFAKK